MLAIGGQRATVRARTALLFLYRVLEMLMVAPLHRMQASRPQRLPVVLTRAEVMPVLEALRGVPGLLVTMLYGRGMRLLDGCSVRGKDLALVSGNVLVRSGKGQKDHVTVLPSTRVYRDATTGELRRHHLHESVLPREVHNAARVTGLSKGVTCGLGRCGVRWTGSTAAVRTRCRSARNRVGIR